MHLLCPLDLEGLSSHCPPLHQIKGGFTINYDARRCVALRRVFNPHAQSNHQPIPTCYRKHESCKKRAYEQRVREVEHGSFTPLFLSLTGGMGSSATVCYKRLASLIAQKRDQPYSSIMAWVRCCLNFALLRSSIQCIRGARSSIGQVGKDMLPPVDLVIAEAHLSV